MELDLKSFSITLSIGVFVAGFFGLSLYILFGINLASKVFQRMATWGGVWPTLGGLFFVVIIFGCGIVGETFSNKLVDDDAFRSLPDEIFATEDEMRTRTLFGYPDKKVPALARELANSGRISRFILDPKLKGAAEKLEILLRTETFKNRAELENKIRSLTWANFELDYVATPLYYIAKNTLMSEDAIAKELATVQSRLDFCRSLAFFSAGFLVLAAALTLFGVLILPLIAPLHPWLKRTLQSFRFIQCRFKVLLCLTFLGLCALTVHCYEAEEREFDIRTFGYFSTLTESKLPKRKSVQEPSFKGLAIAPMDISGAVRLRSGHLVVVSDAKVDVDSHSVRAAVVDTANGSITDLEIKWPEGTLLASDLEAACLIPGTNDILICESGYFPVESETNGRIFRCRPYYDLSGSKLTRLEVTAVWMWPPMTVDIEGLLCIEIEGQKHLIAAKREGVLFDCILPDPVPEKKNRLKFTSDEGRRVDLPVLNSYDRKISDLYVSPSGEVWASAAYEPKEKGSSQGFGPFKSVIYQLGQVTNEAAEPIMISSSPSVYPVYGFKVEAIAAGSSEEPDTFFFGTDDEGFGGIWRLLSL